MKIVFLSAVRYDSVISGRTKHLAFELAQMGNEVFFIEMPSLHNLRIPPFHKRQRDGLQVIAMPPFPLSRLLMDSMVGAFWCACAGFVLRRSVPFLLSDAQVVVSTPWWCRFVERLGLRSVSYDFIDHVSVHCAGKYLSVMEGWERSLLKMSRHIFIIRDRMVSAIPHGSVGHVHVVPNGVPAEWVDVGADVQRPLESGRRLKIGFVGAMYEWIDQELILQTARLLPEFDFVFIGPVRREVPIDQLAKEANIALLPAIPFEQVPDAIRSFDVCIIPFKQDTISDWADPIKLYEYLAFGKPVVSTINFNKNAPILVGRTADEFVQQIRNASSSKADVSERKRFAAQFIWRKQAEKIAAAWLC